MASLAANFDDVRARIAAACRASGREPDEVRLIAVSKHHPAERVRDALACGQRAFGENRVQELVQKAAALRDADDIEWHMIGSLQTNKARDVARLPGLSLLHSLDRRRLADALQGPLEEQGRTLDVLLQVNASHEEQKHGCSVDDAGSLIAHVQERCPALRVQGLMAMGPAAGDPAPTFARVAALREQLRATTDLALPILSLGMSGDLEAAIAAGSTMVRIGTALFGERA